MDKKSVNKTSINSKNINYLFLVKILKKTTHITSFLWSDLIKAYFCIS